MKHATFAAAVSAATLAAGAANAVTQDLNAFAANVQINSLSFGSGISATVTTVSNRPVADGGTNKAVTFDSDVPTGNGDDLGPFSDPSLGMVLIIAGPDNGQGLPDDDAQGGTITFDFNQRVNFLNFDYVDTESPDNELLISASNGFSLTNGFGLTAGNGMFATFMANDALNNITSITFTLEGSGALDNFNVQAIPAPVGGLLLLSGFACVAAARRKIAA